MHIMHFDNHSSLEYTMYSYEINRAIYKKSTNKAKITRYNKFIARLISYEKYTTICMGNGR